MLVGDAGLSPSQTRNLEDLATMPVCDREAVILNVFSRHARTKRAGIEAGRIGGVGRLGDGSRGERVLVDRVGNRRSSGSSGASVASGTSGASKSPSVIVDQAAG